MIKLTHASLFSGIGGWDISAEWCGIENIFQVEIDKFCQKVLEKHFPNVKRYGDIKEFNGTKYRGRIDILTGSFPCQPFSQAGKRKGNKDERALFPEMLRVIKEIQPRWVIAENVYGFLNIHDGEYAEEVFSQLEGESYEVQPFIIPASALKVWGERSPQNLRIDNLLEKPESLIFPLFSTIDFMSNGQNIFIRTSRIR